MDYDQKEKKSKISPNCSKDCSCEFMMSLLSMNVHSVQGFQQQPTQYEGVVTCTLSVPELPLAGSVVEGSQLEDTSEGEGRAAPSEYFTLLHGLISTSTLPDHKPASTPTVLQSSSRHELHDLLTFFIFTHTFHCLCSGKCPQFIFFFYDNIQFPQPLLACTL